MIEYKHQLQNFNWNIRKERTRPRKGKKRSSKTIKYIDDIITFDIETTSAWQMPDGNIIGYHEGETDEFWNSLKPLSIPYIWQCSINDKVYYGRFFDDFIDLLKDIPSDCKCCCWVHNLGFEQEYLQNILTFTDLFARTPHKPIKMTAAEFPNIEFRDSYSLTNMSLETWGDKLGIPKMVGDLDYEKIRTPLTRLTKKEMKYCERDCEVVYAGIKDYLKRYKNQWDIPMTSTGQIRRVCKTFLMSDDAYVRYIKRLVPRNAAEYKLALDLLSGGYAHANYIHAGQTIYPEGSEFIRHRDYKSSYPYVMCAYKFPSGKWVHCGILKIPTDEQMEKYAYIMHLRFRNIKSHNFNTFIQASKARCIKPIIDNGRVREAQEVEIIITEQSFQTIRENYTYDSVEVIDLQYCMKDYLPKEYIDYILKLFSDKETLKHSNPEQYALSKTYVNGCFGMMISAILYASVDFNPNTHNWTIIGLTEGDIEDKLNALRNWSKHEKRYFLSFWWGIWVCEIAKRNLWKCIRQLSYDDDEVDNPDKYNAGYDCLYGDTDSLFYINNHNFDKYNADCDRRLKEMADHYGIDYNKVWPINDKGEVSHLGYFMDEEDEIIEFKTLGAKRYCFRSKSGKLFLTVSGINKKAVSCLNNSLDNFKDGCKFDKDSPDVTKRLHTYITSQGTITWPDGYVSTYDYGINIRRTGYTLTITDEYNKLIKATEVELDIMDDTLINDMRRRWYG